jgi:hypothetical protein
MSREFSLKELITVTGEYKRALNYAVYGHVVLSAAPASSFSFKSVATWPKENYDDAVLRAIVDVLSASDFKSVVSAEFALQAITWHELGSCEFGYYQAAKQATEEILKKGSVADAHDQDDITD